jgi:hypothetical protein
MASPVASDSLSWDYSKGLSSWKKGSNRVAAEAVGSEGPFFIHHSPMTIHFYENIKIHITQRVSPDIS